MPTNLTTLLPFRVTVPLLLVAGLLVAVPSWASTGATRAVVTEVTGTATVHEVSPRGGEATRRRLKPLDLVPAGGAVSLPAGAALSILCSTEHLVRVRGPASWRADEAACREGRRQPVGTFATVVPERGRLVRFGDQVALEMITRAGRLDGVPVLLSPRGTALIDPEPRVVWTAVPGAVEYEIEVAHRPTRSTRTVRVEPVEARCGRPVTGWPGPEVCSLAWPDVAPPAMAPSGAVTLRVGARISMGGSLRRERSRSRSRWLGSAESEAYRKRLRSASGQGFLGEVAAARAAIDLGLYEEARSHLRSALASRDAPALWVTLGDLYLEIDLPERAAESYRRAADTATDPVALGHAAFGLGRASYTLQRFGRAAGSFRRAADHFERAGLRAERAAALRATSAAERADTETGD